MFPASKEQLAATFQKNLKLLSPALREAVQGVAEETLWNTVEVAPNPDGEPVCRYRRGGQSFGITSERPVEEARRWMDAVEDHRTGAIFLFGCGFGYALFEVFRRKQPHTLVVLFERDILLFSAMLHYFDLEPVAASHRVAFLVGDGKCFREEFDNLFTSFHLAACSYPTIACTLPAIRNFKSEYLALIADLFEKLVLFATFVGNDHGDNLLGFCNLVANAEEIVKTPGQSCLKDRFKGFPAFLVANGPSLDRNIRRLKEVRGRGLIISVESAILPLLKNRIRPDILAVMERIPSTYHYHFEHVEFPEDLALLCLAVVDRRVLPAFPGEKIPLFRHSEELNEWVNRCLGDGSGISTGPNVSHLALELALYLGADPIIFVGQDLAYGPDRKTHSKDSVYSGEKGAEADRKIRSMPDVYVEGNDKSMLASNQLWVQFRLELERRLAAHPDRTFLNATEGGSKIEGTTAVSLSDAIARCCAEPIPRRVNEIIAENRAQLQPELQRTRLESLLQSMETYARLFRNQLHETEFYRRTCRKMIFLSLEDDRPANLEVFEKTYRENNEFLANYILNDLCRYFTEQEIFVDYYLLNRMGLVDTPEKITELFTIQYTLFDHLICILQSVSAHMENAAEELGARLEGAGPAQVRGGKLLSACILVNGDEAELAGCLEGMRTLADELLVVSVGPQEQEAQAAEAARRAGAAFYRMDLHGDYARVKNFCLEMAGGKWVLFLRAGERIPEDGKEELRILLRNPNAEGYLLNAENYPERYPIFSPVQSLRLLRNRSEYRFAYRSFELPEGLDTGIYDAFLPITCSNPSALGAELDQRAEQLEREVRQQPEDGYLQYMYGVMLLNRGNDEEGIRHLRSALRHLNLDALYAPHLLKCLGGALVSGDRPEQALMLLNQGIALYPFYTDLLVLRGLLFERLGKAGQALDDFKQSLARKELPDLNVPGPEIKDTAIREMIAQLEGAGCHTAG